MERQDRLDLRPDARRTARIRAQHPQHDGPGKGHGVSAHVRPAGAGDDSGSATGGVLDHVISGEYPVCVMILNYHAAISMKAGAPVRWLKMEPLLQTMGLVSITGNPPHPNAARLMVEFMLSEEGQKILADNDYIPAHPDVPARIRRNSRPDAGKLQGQPDHPGNGARSDTGMDRDL